MAERSRLRRVLSVVNNRVIEWPLAVAIGGVCVMLAGTDGNEIIGWPFVRLLTWVVGLVVAYCLGVHEARNDIFDLRRD